VNAENQDSKSSLSAIVAQYVNYLNQMAAETDIEAVRNIVSLICKTQRLAIMGINRTGFSASQFSYRLSKLGVANYLVTDRVIMMDYME